MSAIESGCTADCDKVLQAWPSFKGMKVGKEMQERLKTGGLVNQDRVVKIEEDWVRRLECLDNAHTKVKGLCVKDAENLVNKLTEYIECAREPACPDQRTEVMRCYQANVGDTLMCTDEVDAFTNCVDDMLRNCGCSKMWKKSSQKRTFREQFNELILDCPEESET